MYWRCLRRGLLVSLETNRIVKGLPEPECKRGLKRESKKRRPTKNRKMGEPDGGKRKILSADILAARRKRTSAGTDAPRACFHGFQKSVWLAVDNAIALETDNITRMYRTIGNTSMRDIVIGYTIKVLHWPHDHIMHIPDRHRELLRPTILKGDYDSVLTLVEFVLQHNLCPQELQVNLENAFQVVSLAYAIQTINGLPTIVPRFSEESGAATQQAIETIEQKGPAGAKAHILAAAKAIEKHYADAVRESIHAVESVARTIRTQAIRLDRPLIRLKRQEC